MRLRMQVTTALAAVMMASAAQAADLPRKAPVYKAPPAVAPFSWTGFYIGGHVGYGWGKKEWSDFFDPLFPTSSNPGPDASYDTDGFLAGGQIGYNWQTGNVVFGIEADASWTDIKGSGNNDPVTTVGPSGTGCLDQLDPCTTKIQALGTITGRLGVAVDRTLFYAKGGAAWVREKHTAGSTDPLVSYHATVEETRWGWTVGAGLEYAFAGNWSGKIEYNYLDFGDDKVSFYFNSPFATAAGGTLSQHMHVVKGGINYRF